MLEAFALAAETAGDGLQRDFGVCLVACGGGGDYVSAVAAEPFTFASGVSSLGTTTTTTVTLGTTTFGVSSPEGTASGNLSFGSCIFSVTSSTFPAGHPLAVGSTVTVQPCSITVATQGVAAAENAAARAVSFVLGGNASLAKELEVDILDDGSVIVEGVDIGSDHHNPRRWSRSRGTGSLSRGASSGTRARGSSGNPAADEMQNLAS